LPFNCFSFQFPVNKVIYSLMVPLLPLVSPLFFVIFHVRASHDHVSYTWKLKYIPVQICCFNHSIIFPIAGWTDRLFQCLTFLCKLILELKLYVPPYLLFLSLNDFHYWFRPLQLQLNHSDIPTEKSLFWVLMWFKIKKRENVCTVMLDSSWYLILKA
jgi:hypothetical protein